MVDLSTLLACSMCKSERLKEQGQNGLECLCCRRTFPRATGILDMLPDMLRGEIQRSHEDWSNWQRMQDIYKTWVKTDWSLALARGEYSLYEDFMRRCDVKDKCLLDLGGFWGMNRAWSGTAAFYFVVDPDDAELLSPSMNYHKELYPFYGTPFPLIKGVGEYLPVRNESLDLIVIQDALDHFLSPQTVIHETYRTLRDGGLIAIMADVSDSSGQRNLLEDALWILKHKGMQGVARGVFWKIREMINSSINRHGHMREFTRTDIVELLSIFAHIEVQDPSVPGFPHLYFFARK